MPCVDGVCGCVQWGVRTYLAPGIGHCGALWVLRSGVGCDIGSLVCGLVLTSGVCLDGCRCTCCRRRWARRNISASHRSSRPRSRSPLIHRLFSSTNSSHSHCQRLNSSHSHFQLREQGFVTAASVCYCRKVCHRMLSLLAAVSNAGLTSPARMCATGGSDQRAQGHEGVVL